MAAGFDCQILCLPTAWWPEIIRWNELRGACLALPINATQTGRRAGRLGFGLWGAAVSVCLRQELDSFLESLPATQGLITTVVSLLKLSRRWTKVFADWCLICSVFIRTETVIKLLSFAPGGTWDVNCFMVSRNLFSFFPVIMPRRVKSIWIAEDTCHCTWQFIFYKAFHNPNRKITLSLYLFKWRSKLKAS